MAINLGFMVLSLFAGAVLLFILFLIPRLRPWHYPVRYVNFDFGVREKAAELASRGPSGGKPEPSDVEEPEEPADMEEPEEMSDEELEEAEEVGERGTPNHERDEPEEPEGWWDRVKMGLYTYPKRPSKQ